MSFSRQGILLIRYSLSAGAVEPAGDLDLAVLAELRRHARHVCERQGHLCEAEGLAGLTAAEDHVLHLIAAEVLGALLTQHPAYGIGDVALAAAVGAHDGGDAGLEVERGLLEEGLKPSMSRDLSCIGLLKGQESS